MNKKLVFGLLTALLLSSCGTPNESVSGSSEAGSDSVSVAPSSKEPKYEDVKDPTEGLLYLESALRPVFANDKQGFKIEEIGNKPLVKFSFEASEDFITGLFDSSSEQNSEYTIELFNENSTIELFNCTKKKEFKTRAIFDESNLKISTDGEAISLTQSYTMYIDETVEVIKDSNGRDKETSVKGVYLDLSRAKLSKALVGAILGAENVSNYNYLDMGTIFSILSYFLPVSDALTRLLPTFIDFVRGRLDSPYGTLQAKGEDYWLTVGIASKNELQDVIDDVLDGLFENTLSGLVSKALLKALLDEYVDQIDSFSAIFDIYYTEGEVKSIEFGTNFKPVTSNSNNASITMDGGFEMNARMFVMKPSEINQNTYPTNLTDRNVWKEIEYDSFL